MRTVEMAALRAEDLEDLHVGAPPGVMRPLPVHTAALLVAAGGAVGAILRFTIAVLVPTVLTPTLIETPWPTLWVNVMGCLAFGAIAGHAEIRVAQPWVMPLLGTGLCGGFTSMSTVVLEGSAMFGADFPLQAMLYGSLTLVLCLGASIAGLLAGRAAARGRLLAKIAAGRRPMPGGAGRKAREDADGSADGGAPGASAHGTGAHRLDASTRGDAITRGTRGADGDAAEPGTADDSAPGRPEA